MTTCLNVISVTSVGLRLIMRKPGVVHRSSIYLMAEENPGKPQLGDHLIKIVQPVIISNGVPCLQMTSVHSTLLRQKEGKDDKDGELFF
jgi:hypothetical protein